MEDARTSTCWTSRGRAQRLLRLDRAYLNYSRLSVRHQARAFFVIRAKKNLRFARSLYKASPESETERHPLAEAYDEGFTQYYG